MADGRVATHNHPRFARPPRLVRPDTQRIVERNAVEAKPPRPGSPSDVLAMGDVALRAWPRGRLFIEATPRPSPPSGGEDAPATSPIPASRAR